MSDCVEWTGGRDRHGYGRVKRHGRETGAHRAVYEDTFGPIPGGMVVMHKCDNPPCVNPDHLSLGTVADNNRDRSAKGRGTTGSRHPQAKLSEEQVGEIRARYAAGGVSQRELAVEYGVHQTNISHIVVRRFRKAG